MDSIELLIGMLKIYSPSGQERELAGYLQHGLKQLGIDSMIDEVGNIIAEIGAGDDLVVLIGHIDTVEGFIPVNREDGEIWGRGAVDAKAPFAAFASAASRVKDKVKGKLVLIGAVEEETITSRGARNIVDKYRPKYAVVGEPGGWDALTIGYKGRLCILYRLDRQMGHSASQGISPLEEVVNYWNRLVEFRERYNAGKPMFQRLDYSLEDLQVERSAFDIKAGMKVYARLPVGLDVMELKEFVRSQAGDGNVDLIDDAPPVLVDKNNKLVRTFLSSIRKKGGTPVFKVKSGTSDMNIVAPAWGIPVLTYGPGDSSLDHTPGEHISEEEYLRSIDVLTAVLEDLIC